MPTMRPQIVKYLLLAYAMLSSVVMHAQAANDSSGNNPPPPAPNRSGTDLPIDEGLILLFFFGVLLGVAIFFRRIRSIKSSA